MLCPSCGSENPDDAAICAKCNYKFRFGHAYNDPGKGTFINLSGKSRVLRYSFFAFVVLVLALVILSWIKGF
jgi:hypothetical protein